MQIVVSIFCGHWAISYTFSILVIHIQYFLTPILNLSCLTLNRFWKYYYCCCLYLVLWSLSCILKRLSGLAIRIFLIVIFLAYDSSYIWMSVYSKSLYFDYVSVLLNSCSYSNKNTICVNSQYSVVLLLPKATHFLSH